MEDYVVEFRGPDEDDGADVVYTVRADSYAQAARVALRRHLRNTILYAVKKDDPLFGVSMLAANWMRDEDT